MLNCKFIFSYPNIRKKETLYYLCNLRNQWLFFDFVFISQRNIPDELYSNEEVVSALPVFFRTLKGDKPSEEELDKIIKLLGRRQ